MRSFLALSLVCLAGCASRESVEEVLRRDLDWAKLDGFQGRIEREFFVEAMEGVYAPKADWREWMRVEDDGVSIARGTDAAGERYFLRFGEGEKRETVRSFEGLKGARIALDPGHIGGAWGPVEHRSFSVGDGPVVQEGDLTLAAAQRIAARLREQGAEVLLLRDSAEPVTELRAEDFRAVAKSRLREGEDEAAVAARLFYLTAEIRARAKRLADWGEVDLAVALHVNASSAGGEGEPVLHDQNDAHVLVNGCYLADELADPVQRLELLLRLVKGYHLEERRLGQAAVLALRAATTLPAYVYAGDNAAALDESNYLWARNLMANRSYDCPVVFFEPWQANGSAVYEWAAAGDYEGERPFGGELRRSLPAVYADFVVRGLELRFGAE